MGWKWKVAGAAVVIVILGTIFITWANNSNHTNVATLVCLIVLVCFLWLGRYIRKKRGE